MVGPAPATWKSRTFATLKVAHGIVSGAPGRSGPHVPKTAAAAKSKDFVTSRCRGKMAVKNALALAKKKANATWRNVLYIASGTNGMNGALAQSAAMEGFARTHEPRSSRSKVEDFLALAITRRMSIAAWPHVLWIATSKRGKHGANVPQVVVSGSAFVRE